jgi:hypothetical protein
VRLPAALASCCPPFRCILPICLLYLLFSASYIN